MSATATAGKKKLGTPNTLPEKLISLIQSRVSHHGFEALLASDNEAQGKRGELMIQRPGDFLTYAKITYEFSNVNVTLSVRLQDKKDKRYFSAAKMTTLQWNDGEKINAFLAELNKTLKELNDADARFQDD